MGKQITALTEAVQRYKVGEKEAFEEIFFQSKAYFAATLKKVSCEPEKMDDILQETYLIISQKINTLENEEAFLSWGARIAVNLAYKDKKKSGKYIVSIDDENQDIELVDENEAFIPESVMESKEKQNLLQDIITNNLSLSEKFCIVGFYYNDMKIKDLSMQLEMPENTVKTNLSRARGKIKLAVLDLAENKNTKLYTCTPLLLLLFEDSVKTMQNAVYSEILLSTVKKLSTNGVARAGEVSAAAGKAGVIKTVVGHTAMKAVIGALAVGTVAVGGTTAYKTISNHKSAGNQNNVAKQEEAEKKTIPLAAKDEDLINSVLSNLFYVQLTKGNAFSDNAVMETEEVRSAFVKRYLSNSKPLYEEYLFGEDGAEGWIDAKFSKVDTFFETVFGQENKQLQYDLDGIEEGKNEYGYSIYQEGENAVADIENIYEDTSGNVVMKGTVTYTTANQWNQDAPQIKELTAKPKDWIGYTSNEAEFEVTCKKNRNSPIGYEIEKIDAPDFPDQVYQLKYSDQEEKDQFGLTFSQEKMMAVLISGMPTEEQMRETLWSTIYIQEILWKVNDYGVVEGNMDAIDYDSAKTFLDEAVSNQLYDFSKQEGFENQDGTLVCTSGSSYCFLWNESQLLIQSFKQTEDGTYEMNGKVLSSEIPAYGIHNEIYRWKTDFTAVMKENPDSPFEYQILSLKRKQKALESDRTNFLQRVGDEAQAYCKYMEEKHIQLDPLSTKYSVDLFDLDQDGILECYWRDMADSESNMYKSGEEKTLLFTYKENKLVEVPLNEKYMTAYFPESGEILLGDADGTSDGKRYKLENGTLIPSQSKNEDEIEAFTIRNQEDEKMYDLNGEKRWYDVYSSVQTTVYEAASQDENALTSLIANYYKNKENVVEVQFERRYTDFPDSKEYADITGLDQDGNIVWTYQTPKSIATQLDACEEIGIMGNRYYLTSGGKVIALNLATGKELWRNSDFGGRCKTSVFDEKGNLYIGGALGPDFVAIDKDGKTLKRYHSFGDSNPGVIDMKYEDGYVVVTTGGPYEQRIFLLLSPQM